jgi:DNA-binding MarR family transcriptional regulator
MYSYHMVTVRTRSKPQLTQQAWDQLLALTMGQRDRFFEAVGTLGLSPGDFKALMSLEEEAPRPIGALAQIWGCDPSNATWMVDRLEERGFIARGGLPGDRRVKTVALTTAGARARREVLARLRVPPSELAELSRDELVALTNALSRLPDSLLADPSPGHSHVTG